MKYVKIPLERIPILIGNHGQTKNLLLEKSGINFNIDSKNGEISINDFKVENPLDVIKLENVVLAIGRGFSPEHAMILLNNDYDLYIFDIHDYVGKKENHVRRLKSRIIGRNGKTKRVLEELTESYISIYGHTVSVISNFLIMDIVKKALDLLLSGSKHATVYRYLERTMKKLRIESKF
jgi:ribosomal RNA assembly protein